MKSVQRQQTIETRPDFSVLRQILESETVTDGVAVLPLECGIDNSEGEFIEKVIRTTRPRKSLEIGMAYGVSSLFICEAMSKVEPDFSHTAIDPFQSTDWKGIGRLNLTKAGLADHVRIIEQRSETALPALLKSGERFDFAFIDGWHTFDHALIDFFFINRMLNEGGVCVLDDYDLPSIRRLASYIAKYPAYERVGASGTKRTLSRMCTLGPLESAKRIGRKINRFGMGAVRRTATMIAFLKTTEDDRPFDWYEPF